MKNPLIGLLLLIACLSITSFSQAKYAAKAYVSIANTEKGTTDEMFSYVSRELRSLGDITVTMDDGDVNFGIIIIIVRSIVGNRPAGYAVSVAIYTRHKCISSVKETDGTYPILSYDDFQDASLYVTDNEGLKEVAQKLVAKFDTRVVQGSRNRFNERQRKP